VVVLAEVKLVARRPNCASTFFSLVSRTRRYNFGDICSPHIHVLYRRSTVGVREASKAVRWSHLRADGVLRHVAITGKCAAVCFLYAWRFGFILVVWNNLSVWREEARVSAVRTAVALVRVWVWRRSCVRRSGVAQLF
jgi:hypothetical protein